MFDNFFNRSKKILLLSTLSVFTLFAVSNIYASPSNEVAYILQGASKTTMTKLVEQVGGEVIHEFSAINAISVSLTKNEVTELTTTNPLVRMSATLESDETAAFVWPIRTKSEIAAFVWPIRTKSEIAAFVWPIRTKSEIAAFVWPIRTKSEIAAFVWPIRTKSEIAAFVWPIRTKSEIAAFVWPIRTKLSAAEFA